MSSCKFRKAAGTWWNRCSASTHIQQGREDRTLIKAIVMLLLHFLTMQQISIHWSNQRVQWGEICCQLIVIFTRYDKRTLSLFFSCFPMLASHFYRNSHKDCKVSRSQTMWATYLASTNNISLHCSLSTYSNLTSSIFQFTNIHISQYIFDASCSSSCRILPEFCTASTKKPPLSSCCSSNTSATTSPNQFINQHCLLIHSGIGFCSSRLDLKNFEISLQRQKSLTFDFRFILWLLNNIVSNFRCLLQSFLCDYFSCIYWYQ